MSGSIVSRLVLKDLYLMRWMIAGALVAGVGAVALMPVNRVATLRRRRLPRSAS